MIEAFETFANTIEEGLKEIKLFLVEHDVEIESHKLTDILSRLPNLYVKSNKKDYVGLKFDENGYIVRTYKIDDFMEDVNLPVDVSHGYYKVVNHKLVLDEERQAQISEV